MKTYVVNVIENVQLSRDVWVEADSFEDASGKAIEAVQEGEAPPGDFMQNSFEIWGYRVDDTR